MVAANPLSGLEDVPTADGTATRKAVGSDNLFGVAGLKSTVSNSKASASGEMGDVLDKLSNMALKRDAVDAFDDLEKAFSGMRMKKKKNEDME